MLLRCEKRLALGELTVQLTEIWLQVRHGTSNYPQLLTAIKADCRLAWCVPECRLAECRL